VVSGSNFLRKDKANIADFNLKINNNTGIDIGNSANINLGIEGTAGIISHRTSGASLFFRVNDQGATRTVLSIDSNTNVGINTTAPSEALEVIGNVKTSGKLFVDDVTNSNSINTGSALFKGGVGIAKKLYVGEESEFGNDVTVKGNIIPSTNDLYNLGASDSLRFDTVYARELRANNINVASITGNLTGSAQQANKLTSQTTFQMSGDVTSAVVNFDGSTGGLSKIFTTAISNTFIANKTATGTSQNSDEILLNRVSGTTGVFKISRDNLFDAIAKMPTGMITPFGGSSAPTHWLLCDGTEYVIGTYPELYAVIGSSFGTATAGYFRVPDLRGRMPLGKDNMGGTSANRVTANAADSVGGFGGDESKVIPVTNLPDHEHDLQGAAGAQYYAIRDVPGIGAGETTAITYDAPTGAGQGSALSSSGGVLSGSLGNAQDVMNPFTTVNYIIYTGQSN
jgi:microcystin-dependent protein